MTPLGTRTALLLAVVTFVATALLITLLGHTRGDFRIDEAHKISETVFLRLFEAGDFSNRMWFENRIDRSNPPVGKYLAGLAIQASGKALPTAPTLATLAVDDYIPPTHSPAVSLPYKPLLPAARRASVAATAATAAILVWILARVQGTLAAGFGLAAYLANYLTTTFWATAVFDPLLTMFVTACLVPIFFLVRRDLSTRGKVLASTALGLLAALAFQVRMSGAVAIVASGVVLLASWKEVGWRSLFRMLLIAGLTFTAAVIAINPLYWAFAPEGTGVDNGPALTRPFTRFAQQLEDLSVLLEKTKRRTSVFGPDEGRVGFTFQIVFGDFAGLATLVGCVLAGLIALLRARRFANDVRLILLWMVTVAVLTIAWLPVAWPRYLLVTVPSFSGIAAIGLAELVRMRWRREAESEAVA